MEITLNGERLELPDGATAAELIEQLGLAGRRYAMEVNGELVPRSAHPGHRLMPGDRVEIVHAVGGG
ncbi:sulfur carrier protein ThiS [Thioalkalivibrio sp. XN8]|uniref:sulfur carrier protein ThiS n=1 Tax=Thioalkalivibrio sp. XN8 TaxID=2712863 RepID=UPI0013EA2C71|nr:sulfur carrier protein ThiS [Thioalkalivibrio sp. XN8]NGP53405.1 sulfur carrier protein ThiS [Thioalkalivibrio sp. XN8]